MDIESSIRSYDHSLKQLYREHLGATATLQSTMIEEILPDVVNELSLDTPQEDRARAWLSDLPTIFRMLKRHRFVTPFALTTLRSSLLWCLTRPSGEAPSIPHLLCGLPMSSRDIVGRPILILRLEHLDGPIDTLKEYFSCMTEALRAALAVINSQQARSEDPVLQYSLLIDMKNVATRNFNIELLTWYSRVLVPLFPGMIATVFMMNFSWTQAGLWSIAKRVLPEPALSKVFFPSVEELHIAIPPTSLPQDYGGSLPSLDDLPSELHWLNRMGNPSQDTPSTQDHDVDYASFTTPSIPPQAIAPTFDRQRHQISSRSTSNPFFGYPVRSSPAPSSSSVPNLRHGRQRKRDLVRTLTVLLWYRWKAHLAVSLIVCVAAFAVRLTTRKWRLSRMFK